MRLVLASITALALINASPFGGPTMVHAEETLGGSPLGAPAAARPAALISKSVKDLAHGAIGAAVKDDIKALRRGPLLMHGNYCGIGNRPGTQPVDALDAACMRHDDCTRTGALPSCTCDEHLRVAAANIANDRETPPDERVAATAAASAMAVLICKTEPGSTPRPEPASIERP